MLRLRGATVPTMHDPAPLFVDWSGGSCCQLYRCATRRHLKANLNHVSRSSTWLSPVLKLFGSMIRAQQRAPQAARNCIDLFVPKTLQCVQVFGVYGIGVDKRHLGLIGDYMMHQVQTPAQVLHRDVESELPRILLVSRRQPLFRGHFSVILQSRGVREAVPARGSVTATSPDVPCWGASALQTLRPKACDLGKMPSPPWPEHMKYRDC